MTIRDAIVVGIDGSQPAWHALHWSAGRARGTGRRLVLAHACRGTAGPAAGRRLLDQATAMVADSAPDVEANTVLRDADPADLLVELSEAADLVVVGRSPWGLGDVHVGSVTYEVLARATVPAAVISGELPHRPNRFLVGLSHSASAAAALRFACTEAGRRGAAVHVVHASSVPASAEAAAFAASLTSPDLRRSGESTMLDSALRHARRAHPSVPITGAMTNDSVEQALDRASYEAALAVLGGRRGGDTAAPRLGPVASWAIQHLTCPVVIVGSTDAAPCDARVAAEREPYWWREYTR